MEEGEEGVRVGMEVDSFLFLSCEKDGVVGEWVLDGEVGI